MNIPQNHTAHGNTVVDMATSLASPPPTRNTSLPGQKRVTFTREQPEIIPQPSKRRQSSVNQRPSWSSVFLLRDSKVRDDVAARSRSLSPGPSILKEFSAFKTDASDAQLKQDEHGNEQKVHISPLWEKNLKRLPRGRQTKKNALPIPQAKVSRNASTRTLSPEDASPRDVSPATLSARHASPREDTFDKSMNVVVHPPSPPESDAEDDDDDDEEVIDDSDESPRHSRNASLEEVEEIEEIEEIDNRFGKIDIDGSSHAHRHEKRDSMDSRKDSQSSRKDSQGSGKGSQEWRESRKSSYGSRRGSQASRKDSKGDDSDRPPPPRRRSSSADQAEMWLRRSSIYGVRSKAPRLPTRLGTMRA
ncbi:hypothetical protein SLS60_001765 [Paraconiothyrium brasiliense]|uniref:Uncharacterized protein n=1 Tax=Paraconiothyrium brasiliense TaxID=300254 RepID=A0ABR3S0A4_9PLEO